MTVVVRLLAAVFEEVGVHIVPVAATLPLLQIVADVAFEGENCGQYADSDEGYE